MIHLLAVEVARRVDTKQTYISWGNIHSPIAVFGLFLLVEHLLGSRLVLFGCLILDEKAITNKDNLSLS